MNIHADRVQNNKELTSQLVDNRPVALMQRKLLETANNSPQARKTAQFKAMSDNYFAKQKRPIQKKENPTGLPDNLKSGMENISGYSLDDIKVHYNSDKPAQLQAHAYAQGNDIHIASGQEKYLPHETWHVIQQKQGRVSPTLQMKGQVNVNDDVALEKEADKMGAQASRFDTRDTTLTPANNSNTVQNKVIQREKYMRATNSDERIENEVNSLRRVFSGEVYRHNSVNSWLDGFAGMPTTRYSPGQQHYYSPVGYMLETNNDADVFANFSGDGNTNNIPKTHYKWANAFNEIITRLQTIDDWEAWRTSEEINLEFVPPENTALLEGIANWCYKYFITDYLTARNNVEESAAGVAQVKGAMTEIATVHIAAHYNNDTQDRFIGTGVNPDAMNTAEDDDNTPYTESILYAKFNQVVAAWYNPDFGAYTTTQAGEDNWINDEGDWQAARKTSAMHIKQQFDAHGSNLEVIALNQATETTGRKGVYSYSDNADNFIIKYAYSTYMGVQRERTVSIPLIQLRDADITYENAEEGTEITIPGDSPSYCMTMSMGEADRFRETVGRFIHKNSQLTSHKEGVDTFHLQFNPDNLSIKRLYQTQMGQLREQNSEINLEAITRVTFEWENKELDISIEHGKNTYSMTRDFEKAQAIRRILLRSGLSTDIVNSIPERE